MSTWEPRGSRAHARRGGEVGCKEKEQNRNGILDDDVGPDRIGKVKATVPNDAGGILIDGPLSDQDQGNVSQEDSGTKAKRVGRKWQNTAVVWKDSQTTDTQRDTGGRVNRPSFLTLSSPIPRRGYIKERNDDGEQTWLEEKKKEEKTRASYPSPVSAQQAWMCHCTVFFKDVSPRASEISEEVRAFFRSCLFAYTSKIAWLRCCHEKGRSVQSDRRIVNTAMATR